MSIVGRTYPPSRPYEVGAEKIREFATAIGETGPLHHDAEAARAAGYPNVVAPPTFAIVLGQRIRELGLLRAIGAGTGQVAVADMGDYPLATQANQDRAEVVVIASGYARVQTIEGTIVFGPVAIPGGGLGGLPTVADFDVGLSLLLSDETLVGTSEEALIFSISKTFDIK